MTPVTSTSARTLTVRGGIEDEEDKAGGVALRRSQVVLRTPMQSLPSILSRHYSKQCDHAKENDHVAYFA